MASKRSDGVDVDAGYERTLPGFVKALGSQEIATVSPEAIAAWLSTFKHPVSKNSHRGRVVSVFRWGRKRGFLPLDVMTAPERVDRAREPRVAIEIVTPEELSRAFTLISEKAPHYIPALAVASLCGLRRAEVHGQLWEHIDLGRSLLRVSAAKQNTPAHRLVPIPPAAAEWLLEHRKKEGPICANLAIDRVRDICRTAGLDLADNGLRHSWISARVAITSNVPEVALDAGNSPRVIHQHYRELMRKDEAEAWFAVRPTAEAGKVVRLG
jgi:integrase